MLSTSERFEDLILIRIMEDTCICVNAGSATMQMVSGVNRSTAHGVTRVESRDTSAHFLVYEHIYEDILEHCMHTHK